jgi:nitronate monooxygenase
MIATRFTELVGCVVPIQQAGMGAAAPPELAAAVSQAGALGMLGTARAGLTAATLADLLEQVRLLTDKPFGVNFIVAPIFLSGTSTRPPLDLKCIEIAARAAKVVEFFYGEPERRLVEMVHAGGALACWQVGSREEAVAAARAGCDFVVAQGVEAGGHVRGTIPTMTLLSEVIAAVDMPVLAAGGIGTGQAMAAALAAGADGVRVGTRFVAAAEAPCIRSTSPP